MGMGTLWWCVIILRGLRFGDVWWWWVGGRSGGSVGHVNAEGIVPKEGPFVQVMFRVRGVNEL